MVVHDRDRRAVGQHALQPMTVDRDQLIADGERCSGAVGIDLADDERQAIRDELKASVAA